MKTHTSTIAIASLALLLVPLLLASSVSASKSGMRNSGKNIKARLEEKRKSRTLHNHHESKRCYNLYSYMKYNNLMQAYANSPDDHANGYATFTLCTDGTLTADANVWGGRMDLIASHVHKCNDGKTGEDCSGPPVINFCGSNDMGMITDAGHYVDECMPYNSNGNSVNTGMTGNMSDGVEMSISDLVDDIGNYPDKYYMNFHSIASWSYWQSHGDGGPVGMCRGPMISNDQHYDDASVLEEERD